MPVYSYRGINEDSKEVRGSVDAPDLESARKSLEDQRLEITELKEASRSQISPSETPVIQPSLQTTFAFEGTDASGVVHRGTIQADTKFQAFDRLKKNQKLMVSMLSPLGVTPQFRDTDLENWQRKEVAATKVSVLPTVTPMSAQPKTMQTPSPVSMAASAKPVGFTLPDTPMQQAATVQKSTAAPIMNASGYHPILSTLRLYAGWLLAWYSVFVAVGYYASVRTIPFDIPFVQAFFVSPLIFSFIVAIFLFLFLGSIHKALQGKLISGIALSIVGIGMFAVVRMSVAG